MAEKLSCFAQDSDVKVEYQDDDSATCVSSAHPDVMKPGAVAQGEDAGLVNFVLAYPGVRGHRVLLGIWDGLLKRVECAPSRHHVAGGVWPFLVVVAHEGVDLTLQLGDRGCPVPLTQPALERLMKSGDLALGLGLTGQSGPRLVPLRRRASYFCFDTWRRRARICSPCRRTLPATASRPWRR
jgi:hypothetical protein